MNQSNPEYRSKHHDTNFEPIREDSNLLDITSASATPLLDTLQPRDRSQGSLEDQILHGEPSSSSQTTTDENTTLRQKPTN